jgi:hypothetical protein
MQALIEETFQETFHKEENNSGFYARVIYPKYEVVFNTYWDGDECVHTFNLITNGKSLPTKKYNRGNYKNLYSRYVNRFSVSKK